MLYALLTRSFLDVNALHDRNPIAVRLTDGSVRNAYTLRLLNKSEIERTVVIDVDGVANPVLHVVGVDTFTQGKPTVVLGRDQTMELRVLVTAAPDESQKSIPLTFRVKDIASGDVTSTTDNFVMP